MDDDQVIYRLPHYRIVERWRDARRYYWIQVLAFDGIWRDCTGPHRQLPATMRRIHARDQKGGTAG